MPLSDSSLWRILKEIKPSQQCSLAGLDDVACDGTNGVTILQQIVKKTNLSSNDKIETVNDLEKAKRYLKIGYLQHCNKKSSVATHCTLCALFNPQDKHFQLEPCENHNNKCKDCFELINMLENISSAVSDLENSQLQDELLYDVSTAVKAILNWMHHYVQSSNIKQRSTLSANLIKI